MKGQTYKGLNIQLTDQQLANLDPTKHNGLTEDDIKIISNNIMQDEKIVNNYLAEYFTYAIEQNWNNNLPMEVKSKMQENAKTGESKINTDYA